MLLRRAWFPLLFAGILVFGLAFYLLQVENFDLSSAISLKNTSLKQPAIFSKDNEETTPTSSTEKLFKLYDGVETFVIFIGYQRSSHSLVGAILDAHPEIIIPHEYGVISKLGKYVSPEHKQDNVTRYALFAALHRRSMQQAQYGIRASRNNTNKGENAYTYHVPGLWQGRYENRIKVIGDKKGGHTSKVLINPNNMHRLEVLSQLVQVPMKFIHVVRNPFDNISTMTLRKAHKRSAARQEGFKAKADSALERSIVQYFQLAAANQRVRERYGDAVIDIPAHETVLRPRETLQKLCDHLGVTCSEEYFEKCSKIMYGKPSVTRDSLVWSEEKIARVTEMMKSYPFFKGFAFDEYPS